MKMKGKKFKIDSDIAKEFINICLGDEKEAEAVINQVLREYVVWQSMKLELKQQEDMGVNIKNS